MRDELQNHTHAGRRRLALKREKQMLAKTLERAKTARERKTTCLKQKLAFELLQEWRGKVEGRLRNIWTDRAKSKATTRAMPMAQASSEDRPASLQLLRLTALSMLLQMGLD